MVQTSALTLFILVAGAVATAAAKQPTFADWLAVKSADPAKKAGTAGSGTAGSPSYEYEDVETEEQCLRGISQKQCSNYGANYQWRSGLACCNSKYYNRERNSFLSAPEEVGTCDYTAFPRDPFVVADKVSQIASFIATCTLQQNAGDCGHPFCDKMVLSVQGEVYKVTDAIVSSLPDAPVQGPGCPAINAPNDLPRLAAPLGEALAKHPLFAEQSTPAKAAYAPDREYYDRPQLYKVKDATMYYGSMYVVSREHNVKTQTGWFEHVSRIEVPTTGAVPVEHPEESYVLDPYVYKLTFIKNKGY